MEWNAKWDWENLVMFNSKTIGSPKKQPTSWGIGEGEFDTGSFNLSEGGCGGSSSELVHGSSVSISASTDTSSKEVLKPTMISFEAFQAAAGGFSKKNGLAKADVYETSPLEASVGSGEPLIGLKLGKRTYFENHGSAGITKNSSFSMIPVSSSTVATTKKIKPSCHNATSVRCQVEGCNLDLSSSKEYHRKHRVCESHSKCPKVTINGFERRFCQQCSRFHSLSEFDEKKKSCRRRLNDHNARRRKPQPQPHQFNPARLSASFLDGRQQMSFVLNHGPLVHSRSSVSPMWETARSSKFTITEGSPLKSEKVGGGASQLQVSGTDMMHAIYTSGQNFNRLLPLKGTKTELFTQGVKEPMLSSSFDAAHDVHRALSLLSTDSSWGPEPANVAADNLIHVNLANMPHQPVVMHRGGGGVPQGLPLMSPENWQAENATDFRRLPTSTTANDNGHYQEIQLFKTPPAYNSGVFF